MNISQGNRILIGVLAIALSAVLAGCDRPDDTDDAADQQAHDEFDDTVDAVDQQGPAGEPAADQRALEHVAEFDGYTLRANVSRTDSLPEAMAQEYGIEPDSDRVLLNLVILEDQPDRERIAVAGDVDAQYETRSGNLETIDMRAVEMDGHVSYVGTLDASDQRMFELDIMARPEGTDEPLQMTFEVELRALDALDSE